MTTFGAWLGGQENRSDDIGELARYWKGVKGSRPIRALPGVENALKEAGAFAEGSPVKPWWDTTVAAWRASRSGSLATGDLTLVPPPPEPGQGVAMGVTDLIESGVSLADRLDGIVRFLAAIAVRLGMSTTEVQRLAGQAMGPAPEPIDWAATMAAADYGASDEAG